MSKHYLQPSPFLSFCHNIFIFNCYFQILRMVFTRSQIGSMDREELIKELLNLSDGSIKLTKKNRRAGR